MLFTHPHPLFDREEDGSREILYPNDLHTHDVVKGLIRFGSQIWNPTTRKCFNLPRPRLSSKMNIPVDVGSEFLLEYENSYYLGFDSVTKQYKVLSLICFRRNGNNSLFIPTNLFEMQVFTLGRVGGGRGTWGYVTDNVSKEAIKGLRVMCYYPPGPSIYVKDEIYILVGFPKYLALMFFSVGQERFRFISLPAGGGEGFTRKDPHMWVMVEVGGCVALMKKMNTTTTRGMTEIWRLMGSNKNSNTAHHEEGVWEKIIYDETWPTRGVKNIPELHNQSDSGDELIIFVGEKSDRENASLEKWKEKSYCIYRVRHGMRRVLRTTERFRSIDDHQDYQVFCALVENLFDPTTTQKQQQLMIPYSMITIIPPLPPRRTLLPLPRRTLPCPRTTATAPHPHTAAAKNPLQIAPPQTATFNIGGCFRNKIDSKIPIKY
ncbi:OLC1v1031555C1 [Oldenlandia corymbosa var. corymbosa]|uniref:OLC1v1031555C1 n=1 Tax=Oldenlandia corymbosa var. corymbosa TaxID=529605 RepID=A0AAV1CJJ6_OLDCO|nr:OLC1v1031555C1 [Oldenlandia corymbosa var. corymbosa]